VHSDICICIKLSYFVRENHIILYQCSLSVLVLPSLTHWAVIPTNIKELVMFAVRGEKTLKINGNETRYQIVQVTSLFRFRARTCQTKHFFKQSYVNFLASNLFASCAGTRVRSSNWLEICQLHAVHM
jgi:hypothetical protein